MNIETPELPVAIRDRAKPILKPAFWITAALLLGQIVLSMFSIYFTLRPSIYQVARFSGGASTEDVPISASDQRASKRDPDGEGEAQDSDETATSSGESSTENESNSGSEQRAPELGPNEEDAAQDRDETATNDSREILSRSQKGLDEALGLDKCARIVRSFVLILYGTDQSAITPLLLCYFTLQMLIGFWTCMHLEIRGHNAMISTFPFPVNFTTTYVQFGLMGTLWGFMLLGFGLRGHDIGNASTQTIELLVDAFGTALLSTFTAIVLAFALAPCVRRFFSLLLLYAGEKNVEESSTEFVGWMDKVVGSLRDIAGALEANQVAMEKNNASMGKCINSLVAKIKEVESAIQDMLDKPSSKIALCLDNIQTISERICDMHTQLGGSASEDTVTMRNELEQIGQQISVLNESIGIQGDAYSSAIIAAADRIRAGGKQP